MGLLLWFGNLPVLFLKALLKPLMRNMDKCNGSHSRPVVFMDNYSLQTSWNYPQLKTSTKTACPRSCVTMMRKRWKKAIQQWDNGTLSHFSVRWLMRTSVSFQNKAAVLTFRSSTCALPDSKLKRQKTRLHVNPSYCRVTWFQYVWMDGWRRFAVTQAYINL